MEDRFEESVMILPGTRYFPDDHEVQVWPEVFREEALDGLPRHMAETALAMSDESLACLIAFAVYEKTGVEYEAVKCSQCGDKSHFHITPEKGE